MSARFLFLWLSVAAIPASLLAAGELPSPSSAGLSGEPSLILSDLPEIPLPPPTAPTSLDLAKLESDVRRARDNAASAERLWKAGVLAKVEAEKIALHAVSLAEKLAAAQWRSACEEAARAREKLATGAGSADEAARCDDAAVAAEQAACEASARCRHALIEAAAKNLWRRQTLRASGYGSKSEVQRAERQLTALQRQGE
jgi:hypothetical protein